MTELRTVEGGGRIITDEGEDVIHQLTEMRVTETHTSKPNNMTAFLFF